MDDETNFFHAVIRDTGYLYKIPAMTRIEIKGEILDFQLSRDEKNPALEMPNFIIAIDSFKIVK